MKIKSVSYLVPHTELLDPNTWVLVQRTFISLQEELGLRLWTQHDRIL